MVTVGDEAIAGPRVHQWWPQAFLPVICYNVSQVGGHELLCNPDPSILGMRMGMMG
jgi:hypothetical protein